MRYILSPANPNGPNYSSSSRHILDPVVTSHLKFEEVDEEAVDGEDDEDVPVTLIVTEVDGGDLPVAYKTFRDGIVYDETWDETAELVVNNEVKEGELEKRKIRGVRIRIRKMGEAKTGESEVEDFRTESNKMEENDDNDENLIACRPGVADGKRQLPTSACV